MLARGFVRLTAFVLLMLAAAHAFAADADPDPADWPAVLEEARGQTVYWYAWGGAQNINDYISWVGERVSDEYGVTLEQVKVSETASLVTRVLSEKQAGRNDGGAVDLVWINGENFKAMKEAGLLLPYSWSTSLPNYALTDFENKPVLSRDFTEPVDGLESPWGTAQFTFYCDSASLPEPPRNLDALKAYIHAHPGRFTYAAPPNFIGTTFLKQVLLGLADDRSILSRPVDEADFDKVTAPLWAWLDDVTPDLWRSGAVYAADTTQLKTLLADDEIDIAMTFNPGEASSAISEGILPDTVRSFVLDYGSIGNAHFVAIPFNANAKAGAMVVANFLLSPEAQARKADESLWGDPTVLAYAKLDADGKARFDMLQRGLATLGPDESGAVLNEPDSSWTNAIEAEWARRFGAAR
ncbi:MAG: ABC transporter substrate-binding protein [Hyphomicrobiaceae bacterium]|nr:ABC transporter substrate-binding protein [Hyphomicrobiaceae bacterium]